MNRSILVLLCIVLILATVAGVAAVSYVLQLSNQVSVEVTSGIVYVPVTLTSNATAITDVDTVNLTATVQNSNAANLIVTFRVNGNFLDSAPIAFTGGVWKAEIYVRPAVGTRVFTAGP